ncbi:MAG: hypothetical protein LBI01_03795 [Elusimicrobium sp.]|jgi:outer membrane protein assembly factor BamA|nr:hypothetical protein [Elusimicrobium sp.]
MKLKTAVCAALLLLPPLCARAQNYDGCTVKKINITARRMNPDVARDVFPLKEGCVFNQKDYLSAQQELHNMRVAKEIDFNITPVSKDAVNIDINIKDGYYIFPLPFYTSSGGRSAFALALVSGNVLKMGETNALFFAAGNDGQNLSDTLALDNNIFQIKYTHLNFTQRFYDGGWSSVFGVLNTGDDEGKFGAPLKTLGTKRQYFSMMYGRKMGRLTAWIMPAYDDYEYSAPADAGNHNKISAGLTYRKGARAGANMGALFGLGLSDKKSALAPLNAPKLSYTAGVSQTAGGGWLGADYDINKTALNFDVLYELKTHHTFYFGVKAEDGFNSPFSDDVKSLDLLSGTGKYSRQIRGARGAGFGAAITYYLLRTETGLLSLQPFYELAYVYNDNTYRPHSGTGVTLAYKFWRFPFPLGINYTHNLSDSSNMVGFSFGANF